MPEQALVEATRALLTPTHSTARTTRRSQPNYAEPAFTPSKHHVLRLTHGHRFQAPATAEPAAWPEGTKRHHPKRTHGRSVRHRSNLSPDQRGPEQRFFVTLVTPRLSTSASTWPDKRRIEALQPLHQGVRACFSTLAQGITNALKLSHDHGRQFITMTTSEELRLPQDRRARPPLVHAAEGNGFVERFIPPQPEDLFWVPRLRRRRRAAPGLAHLQGHLRCDLDRRAPPAPRRQRPLEQRGSRNSRLTA